ncbi:unnamed protein product, partial [Ectocarpus sp. 4 AP-2014]
TKINSSLRRADISQRLKSRRQESRCNCCAQSITLYPFANCDADHIVRICRGEKTVPEDVQLLCEQDHRAKSAREPRVIFDD